MKISPATLAIRNVSIAKPNDAWREPLPKAMSYRSNGILAPKMITPSRAKPAKMIEVFVKLVLNIDYL